MNLSILIATNRSEKVKNTLNMLLDEVKETDDVVVVFDNVPAPGWIIEYPFTFFEETDEKVTGVWGHKIRNRYIPVLRGDYIMNMDDDDRYTHGWREKIEKEISDSPDIVLFSYQHINKGKVLDCICKGSCRYICSSNLIFRNASPFNEVKYYEFRGGDMKRGFEMTSKTNKIKTSEFILFEIEKK